MRCVKETAPVDSAAALMTTKRPHVPAGEIGVRRAMEQFAIEVFGEHFSA